MSTTPSTVTNTNQNPVLHVLSEIGHGALKAIESPVVLIEDIGKASKVLATVIVDEPTLRTTLTTMVTDGLALSAKVATVIAEKGSGWTDDIALVASIEAYFEQDIESDLVPLVRKLYGEIKADVASAATSA